MITRFILPFQHGNTSGLELPCPTSHEEYTEQSNKQESHAKVNHVKQSDSYD